METDVVISDQHDQFCVGGMSEHPVEAAHVVLPVLRRERTTQTELRQLSVQGLSKTNLPRDAGES